MNHSSHHAQAPELRLFAPADQATCDPSEIATLAQQCICLLDAEFQFYDRLESLLTGIVTANLFSTDAATALSRQVDELQRQRDDLQRDRTRCQQTLASVLDCPADDARMSDLEALLLSAEGADLRQRRLRVASRIRGMQPLMRRIDVLLHSRHFLFTDFIATLTGQSPSANCYGADGRRDGHMPISVTHAIS